MPNEQELFLKSLETDQDPDAGLDILEQPLDGSTPVTGATGESAEDDDGTLKPRNRRERRLMRKLDAERESAIYLSGKLAAREEAKSAVSEERDYLKKVERIYGTESPEAQIATDLLKQAIIGARDEAKALALEEMRAERQREQEEAYKAEREINAILEDVEDTYDVSLSDAQEKAYLELLRKMSMKDEAGSVVALADPHAVWEVFQERISGSKRVASVRAKEVSSRSLAQGGASQASSAGDDVSARWLQENGII